MRADDLAAVAELAGYPLSAHELEEVAAILAPMLDDLEALRAMDLPDEVEPILTFRVDPWQ
jgi:hypothetical protein